MLPLVSPPPLLLLVLVLLTCVVKDGTNHKCQEEVKSYDGHQWEHGITTSCYQLMREKEIKEEK